MPLNKEKCFSCGATDKLYPAPTSAETRHKWLEAIPNAHSGIFTNDFRLCQSHFTKNSIVFGRHLLRSAVPSLFLSEDEEAFDEPQTLPRNKAYTKKQLQSVSMEGNESNDSTLWKSQPEPASEQEEENSDSDASSTVIIIEEVSEPVTDPLAIPDSLECSPSKSAQLTMLQKLKRLKLRVPLTPKPQEIRLKPKESPAPKIVQQTAVKSLRKSSMQKVVQPSTSKQFLSSQVQKSVQPTATKPVQDYPVQKIGRTTIRKRLLDSPLQQTEEPTIKKRLHDSPVLKIQPRAASNNLRNSLEKKESPLQKGAQSNTAKSLHDSPSLTKHFQASPVQKIEQTTTATKRLQASIQKNIQPTITESVQNATPQRSPLRTTPKPIRLSEESMAVMKSPSTTLSPAVPKTIKTERNTTPAPSSKPVLSKITYPLQSSGENSLPEGRIKIAEMSIERLKLKIERVNLRSRDVRKRINVLKYKIKTYQEFIAKLVAKNIISRESKKKFEVLPRDIKRKARRDAMKIHKQGGRDLLIDPVTDHDYL